MESTLLFITASVNSLLSFFVLFGKRDKTNIIYSVFVLFASFWSIGLGLFIIESDLNLAHSIANFYYISAAGIPLFFLYFSFLFPHKNFQINNIMLFILSLPLLILTFLLVLDKELLIKQVFLSDWGKDVIIDVKHYVIYTIYFVSFTLLAYYNLIKSYLSSSDSEERKQLKFIILGTTVGFIFGMIFDLFLPLIGDYKHIFVGPLFSFSMVIAIGYSITRHHLFDIKVVATEVLTFILWIAILIQIILAEGLKEQLINLGFLIVAIFLGILLIRSVIKEVTQREKIEKLAEELKKINVGQNSMIHFMNHQIKGRFGVAKNIFAELLSEDYGKMPEDTVPLIKKGLEETNTGINYVQSILKGATAENGSLQYDKQPMDFKNLVEEAVNGQKDKAEAKGLKFDLSVKDGDYSFTGDALQLGEAVRNLIDNSINYTLTGSILMKLENKEKSFVFEIIDTGVGITPEDMGNLFKAGGRGANSLKVNVNSTGYGLVFVKNVVEAHGGRVWVESRGEGKGSTFSVELPKNN